MLNALRSTRAQHPSLFSSSSYSLPNHLTQKKTCGIRFAQAAAGSSQPDGMDPKPDPVESRTKDTMSSFGVGYATRSDEEGFGGIYGGNQYAGEQEKVGEDEDDDKKKTGPEVDDTQGSDVKEKEKARNQRDVVQKS